MGIRILGTVLKTSRTGELKDRIYSGSNSASIFLALVSLTNYLRRSMGLMESSIGLGAISVS